MTDSAKQHYEGHDEWKLAEDCLRERELSRIRKMINILQQSGTKEQADSSAYVIEKYCEAERLAVPEGAKKDSSSIDKRA